MGAAPAVWLTAEAVYKHVPGARDAIDGEAVLLPQILDHVRGGCGGDIGGSLHVALALLAALPRPVAGRVEVVEKLLDAMLPAAAGRMSAAERKLLSSAAGDTFVYCAVLGQEAAGGQQEGREAPEATAAAGAEEQQQVVSW